VNSLWINADASPDGITRREYTCNLGSTAASAPAQKPPSTGPVARFLPDCREHTGEHGSGQVGADHDGGLRQPVRQWADPEYAPKARSQQPCCRCRYSTEAQQPYQSQATGADEVFGQLLLTRIIEPTNKLDILVKPAHVIVPAFG